MTSWTWLLDKVGGGTPGHSAAWSLHVAGQGRRHEEHLGENDRVVDVEHSHWVDDLVINLIYLLGVKGHPVVSEGKKESPDHL